MELPSALFSPSSKNKKNPPSLQLLDQISYTPEKWNFLTLILKNFLHFLKRKLFLCFEKRKPRKSSLYFREWIFLLFWETETLKKSLYFRRKLPNLKNGTKPILKKFLIFWGIELLAPSLKNFLYSRTDFTKPQKQIKNLFWSNFLSLVTFL